MHRHKPHVPDEISRSEDVPVSTQFDPDTGRRVKRGVVIAGAALLVCFLLVSIVRIFDARALSNGEEAQFLRPPGGPESVEPDRRNLSTTGHAPSAARSAGKDWDTCTLSAWKNWNSGPC